jgi:hypothetical protein
LNSLLWKHQLVRAGHTGRKHGAFTGRFAHHAFETVMEPEVLNGGRRRIQDAVQGKLLHGRQEASDEAVPV